MIVLHEDKWPQCHAFVREGAESCPACGATWENPKGVPA